MKNETPDLIAEQQALMNRVKAKTTSLKEQKKLEGVTVIQHDKTKIYMEHIAGTTKYLSNVRKIIYDLTFLKLYNFDYHVPEGCLAIGYYLFKIDKYAHINNPEAFLSLLESPLPMSRGTRFYLDNTLYMENVPFSRADLIRDDLLNRRKDGIEWFDVLKIVDPSGNETLFYPSKKVRDTYGK